VTVAVFRVMLPAETKTVGSSTAPSGVQDVPVGQQQHGPEVRHRRWVRAESHAPRVLGDAGEGPFTHVPVSCVVMTQAF
jgi:hypothetical protein